VNGSAPIALEAEPPRATKVVMAESHSGAFTALAHRTEVYGDQAVRFNDDANGIVGDMTSVVCPGLGLDRDGDPAGRDRHRVDVTLALPRQRVPKPPPLRLESGERALHLVLRVL